MTALRLDDGGRLLLGSEGLTNEICEDLILSTMESQDDLSAGAAVLIDVALTNGGHDNITVAIAEVAA